MEKVDGGESILWGTKLPIVVLKGAVPGSEDTVNTDPVGGTWFSDSVD